jgi:beclin 1
MIILVGRQLTPRYLLSHAHLSTEVDRRQKALSTARTKLLLSSAMLRHLEATNVYNDAFQIGHVPLHSDAKTHSGASSISVGTINGLRLGGRPVVEWDEINAAWGLVALCIDRIAAKIGCVFDSYVIPAILD